MLCLLDALHRLHSTIRVLDKTKINLRYESGSEITGHADHAKQQGGGWWGGEEKEKCDERTLNKNTENVHNKKKKNTHLCFFGYKVG